MDMSGMVMTTSLTESSASTTSLMMNMATSTTNSIIMNMSGTATSSMDMGSTSTSASDSSSSSSSSSSMSMTMTCTMSMLWNWYSKDVCFISSQWKTSTKAIFGGTCVGCFALLIVINWWRRILTEYKIYCAEIREKEIQHLLDNGVEIKKIEDSFTHISTDNNVFSEFMIPLKDSATHKWYWALNKNLSIEKGDKIYIYPSIFEHLIYCVGDTIEWSVHHVIMLLFMYFNGYVFISCMIGAGTGFLLMQYKNINISRRGDNVSKRCCL